MKNIILIHLVTLISIMNVFSQNFHDSPQNPTCFMIARAAPKALKSKNVSEIFCIGDKVKVKLWDNQMIQGTIGKLSRDSVITVDLTEIDFKTIQSIAKTESGTATNILGGAMIVGGTALLLNGSDPDGDLNSGAGQSGLGAAIIACGIFTLAYHSRFKVEIGDHMIFKD